MSTPPEDGSPKRTGISLLPIERRMIDLMVAHYYARPEKKRSETLGLIIRAQLARLIRQGGIPPPEDIPPAEYLDWDRRAGD